MDVDMNNTDGIPQERQSSNQNNERVTYDKNLMVQQLVKRRQRACLVPDLLNSLGLAQYNSAFYGQLEILSVQHSCSVQNSPVKDD